MESVIEVIVQCGITLFGVAAVFLLAAKSRQVRRWGYVAGLCSEPFWFAGATMTHQWGVQALVLIYTAAYIIGLRNNFSPSPETKL